EQLDLEPFDLAQRLNLVADEAAAARARRRRVHARHDQDPHRRRSVSRWPAAACATRSSRARRGLVTAASCPVTRRPGRSRRNDFDSRRYPMHRLLARAHVTLLRAGTRLRSTAGRPRSATGQGTVEYVALILLVALVM